MHEQQQLTVKARSASRLRLRLRRRLKLLFGQQNVDNREGPDRTDQTGAGEALVGGLETLGGEDVGSGGGLSLRRCTAVPKHAVAAGRGHSGRVAKNRPISHSALLSVTTCCSLLLGGPSTNSRPLFKIISK